MSNNELKQYFTELEFCLNKYFSENFSPIVSREYDSLQKKKSEEIRQSIKSSSFNGMMGGSLYQNVAQLNALQYTGKWNSKDNDWLLQKCQQDFIKNSDFRKDLNILADNYRVLCIQQLGEKQYKNLSKSLPTGDLSLQYVTSRFEELFIDKLAKKDVPKSSLEYIMKKGFSESLMGWLFESTQKTGKIDEKIHQRTEDLYRPSTAEKFASKGVRIGTDILATGGAGSWGTLSKSVALEVGVEILSSSTGDPQEFSKQLGKLIFNSDKAFISIQNSAKKVSPKSSYVISSINAELSKKLKIPAYTQLYSPKEEKNFSSQFLKASNNSATSMLNNITKVFSQYSIYVNKQATIPAWMKKLSRLQCYDLSANFAGKACEMKSKGKTEIMINGKNYTYKEVCQRAYDYARMAKSFEHTTEPERHQAAYQSSTSQTVTPSDQPNTPTMNANPQNNQSTVSPQPNKLTGWEGLMTQMGYSAFGDVYNNLGYVFAMLPDLIIGMFIGKNKNLNVKDNILPISAILMGLFTKRNPILKLMLLGFGGISLLKKAGKEIVENVEAKDGISGRMYKVYPDEKLNPRITDVAMKGNTMLCTIDGSPLVLTISDTAVDAYYKGKIPLNTLANKVLERYDEQEATAALSYNQVLTDSEKEKTNLALK